MYFCLSDGFTCKLFNNLGAEYFVSFDTRYFLKAMYNLHPHN